METLYKIEEEILQLFNSRESSNGNGRTTSTQSSNAVSGDCPHSRDKLGEAPRLILRAANERKFRNSATDLIINTKDLKSHKTTVKKHKDEEIKSNQSESGFVKDFKINATCTEINIQLEKAITISQIIKEIFTSPLRIKNNEISKNMTLIFVNNYKMVNCDDVQGCFSYARCLAVSAELKNILEVNGDLCHIIVDQQQRPNSEAVEDLFPDIVFSDAIKTEFNKTEKMLTKNARESEYRLNTLGDKNVDENPVGLDFEQYLLENGLKKGKDGFDKNLQTSIVVKEDGEISNCLKSAVIIEHSMKEAINDSVSNVSLLIVSPDHQCWEAQKTCICWKMLSSHRIDIAKLALCCCGGCSRQHTSNGEFETVIFNDYFRQKSMEIRQSYISRYGSEVHGEDWEKVIADVATACIKLDLLSSPLRHMVHSNISRERSHVTSSRDSIFILYNYSRLSTLLRKYEDEQKSAKYPPLPDITEIDFSNLREEQEWRIFVKYVLSYPILIKDLYESISESTTFQINPSINKITSFLSRMARDLSSYYHQTKVLLDPMAHLFPLMFARIYFIQVLEKVMQSAFKLIGIKPPVQM